MVDTPLTVVILAAGQGTRMHSDMPKVLHRLADRPLLEHVVGAAHALGVERPIIVYGHGGRHVPEALGHLSANWIEQAEQLGTGHAVRQAIPAIADEAILLVLYGDVPLIRPATLRALVAACGPDGLGLLTVELAEPRGYGRILRGPDGAVTRVVEEKDASAAERRIREVNTGMLASRVGPLRAWLARLDNANAQGEYYLTDVIAMAAAEGVPINTAQPDSATEVLGVNDQVQLATLERSYQAVQADALMRAGVCLRDPARFDLRGRLQAGRDVVIDANVLIEGDVRLGDRVRIGPNVVLRDCTVGNDVCIEAHCVLDQAAIGAGARVGPFARLRPETELAERVHVGNFVEIKKSRVGAGSKINHLSYVGDSTVGRDVNIGAGTITCNYDGAHKHRTVIGDAAFIGSDTQLVAPVEVGAGATIGAGSTITRDAPAGELTLSRARQTTVPSWQRPRKEKR